MWKLKSNRYVEEVMQDFNNRLNYEHPSCSLILDVDDDHWQDIFEPEEIKEIKQKLTGEKEATEVENHYTEAEEKQVDKSTSTSEEDAQANEATTITFPEHMKRFLDNIPQTTNIKAIFLHLNRQVIDPFTDRDLYWLKNTLQQSADLFVTKYIPLTDQGERDIVRRVWNFIDLAYDTSELTFRGEKSSFSCLLENNKRRKVAAKSSMDRQRSAEIPDMLIFYDRFEFGAAEVSKTETDLTKELNDGSVKLAKIMKSMLVNLANCCPPLQHDMKIVGMFFSGLKVSFLELGNPAEYVCVMNKTKELYFPVHEKEFLKRTKSIVEQVRINKLEVEARLDQLMLTESGNEQLNLLHV